MPNHQYTSYITPVDLLQFTNNCINTQYYHCNKCGFQNLTVLDEIIVGPGNRCQKIMREIYLLNNKIVNLEEYQDLTCEEVVIKMLVE